MNSCYIPVYIYNNVYKDIKIFKYGFTLFLFNNIFSINEI